MKQILWMFILGCMFLTACEQDRVVLNQEEVKGVIFKLYDSSLQGETSSRANVESQTGYNRLDYYIMDALGKPVKRVKSMYDHNTRKILAEGLREGDYTLLVLGVKGDPENDNANISTLTSIDELWLSFPQEMNRPLESEYFYAKTPFRVVVEDTPNGEQETVYMEQEVVMNRIVGRMDVVCRFNNPYVEYASSGSRLQLNNAVFYTSFSADGHYSGATTGALNEIDLDRSWSFYFLPSVESSAETEGGEVIIQTRTYKGETVQRSFSFQQIPVTANRVTQVNLQIQHPEDTRGTLFVTEKAYHAAEHGLILQDDEPVSVYTDPTQRSFSALEPLQLKITEDNRLNARFYCPRPISGVSVKALIPSVTKEWLDFAYFDHIPGLGDVYLDIPRLNLPAMFYTESGKQIRIPNFTPELLREATFKVVSVDECWKRLSQIKYNYGISGFSLYGGDPSKPDGGPNGNWKGIRPVHCREAVAVILNVAFMLSQDQEMETLMKANESYYKDNGGNPVSADRLLSQLRQGYQLKIGLVNAAYSNTVGLAGTSGTFGMAQDRWLYHYNTNWAPTTIFHELGHVMGYSHSSTLTYGHWAQQVVNKYYLDHIKEFPIDSPDYLNSKGNPFLYSRN